MGEIIPYNREAAVAYAHLWAFHRNPAYLNFDQLGGDCTNFASQSLFAGSNIMNHTPTFGWYYYSGNNKAPAWTGVTYFRNFLTRKELSPGPFAQETDSGQLLPGDFVQLRFGEGDYGHTPIVVSVGKVPSPDNILLAAHSQDADFRPLSSYPYQQARFLHILGVRTY